MNNEKFKETKISRRHAISKVAAVGGIVAAGVITGLGGYLAGSNQNAQPPQTATTTITQAITRTLTQPVTTTVEVTPRLTPVDVNLVTTSGARNAAFFLLPIDDARGRELASRLGLNIRSYRQVRGTGEAITDVLERRADIILAASIDASLQAMERGVDIRFIHFNDRFAISTFIGRKGFPHKTLDQMRDAVRRGERIRVGYTRPGGLSYFNMLFLAAQLGTKEGEGVIGLSLGEQDAILAAMARNEVDLYGTTLGFALQTQERGIADIILKESTVRGALWHSWTLLTNTETIERRPELVARVVAYTRELIKLCEVDRDYAVSLMMKEPPAGYGYSKAVAESYYDEMLWNHLGAPNASALSKMRDEYTAWGLIRSVPPLANWYTTRFL
ncbi:MAG: hypothetical protein NZ920_05370 [Aigarchaeota archaeon]|nr:hypothetical protein [Aigarchaeota archaeon]MDW8092874.1 hypothetical protein [Nitrososphaerota archaeon]